MSRILLIGGGGFAKEVHEIADLNGHQVIGYVADTAGIVDLPHLGSVDRLSELRSQFDQIIVAFGAVDRRSIVRRAELIGRIEAEGYEFASLVSPRATIARGASIGAGAFVAHGVVVSVDAKIGKHAILNTSAVIGHDAVIGERAIVAPCAFLGGAAIIGKDCLVGPNAVVLEGRCVGSNVIISLGSLVLRNVADGMTILPTRSPHKK
jgi:acetyltransferase EpsM